MDENKRPDIGAPMDDNEKLFESKKGDPASDQRPAYMQRRGDSAPRIPGGEETVINRPIGKRSEGQSGASRTAPQPQRRPAQPAGGASPGQRPMSGSSPVRPAQSRDPRPAAPSPSGVRRPAPASQGGARQGRPVSSADPAAPSPRGPAAPRPAGAGAVPPARPQGQQPQPRDGGREAPTYQQRRGAVGGDELPNAGEKVVSAAEKKPVSEKKKPEKKPENEKKSDKQKNAKAGADMMVGIVKAIAYMVVIIVVSVFISIFVIRVGNDVFAFVKSDEAVDVTIPEDADVSDIAEILHDNGVINFPGIFKMYASLKEEKGPFVAGDYTVSPSMSYDDLRRSFKKQVETGTVWITIPEGYTTDEIIDLMVENGIGERDKYIEVINNYDFDYWFIDELEKSELKEGRVYRLEGYLFPDTYEFYKSSSEEMVIGRLLKRFDEVFVEDYRTKAAELGYTVDEILTIASLVEKEAGGMGDFMYVSSVFHNRLNNPAYYPKMESDATTVYAIQVATGKRPDKVTPEDNKFDHPYNTYLYPGLTPGPITNPSASAIRYALYPAKSDYYYFITDNAGKVYYASGKVEHENNIEYVRKINEQLANG